MDTIEIRNMSADIGVTATKDQDQQRNIGASCPVGNCPADGDGHVYFGRCQDFKEFELGDTEVEGSGRLLHVNLTLKNVCPNRRIALGLLLRELGNNGLEETRGFRAMVVPAHNRSSCIDIPLSTIRFVLPEELHLTGASLCSSACRHFLVRVIAHYVDTNAII